MNSGYVGINFVNNDKNNPHNYVFQIVRFIISCLSGLIIQNGNVTVTNTEISNSSSYCVFLNGGNHDFTHLHHCQLFRQQQCASHFTQQKSGTNDHEFKAYGSMENTFKNCIISGSAENSSVLPPKRWINTREHLITVIFVRQQLRV